ncbi:MAG: ATP synthase F1 subunit gamma [Planctomycetota bacterium]
MGKTREIRKRMKAVGNIRRITRTMQMIATAKFSASQSRAVAGRPYTDALFAMVNELAGAGGLEHPLLAGSSQTDAKGKEITLIITSDRGLCGPYNGSILRTASKHLGDNADAKAGNIEIVGKKGVTFAKFNEIEVAEAHSFGDNPSYEQIESLAQRYIDGFEAGDVSKVTLVSMRFVSAGKQVPEVQQLLPLEPPAADETASAPAEYEFSPAGPELLAELLPAAIKARLFQAFNDAIISEHVARMVAMKAATDNAGKMGKDLSRQYNRARQAQITTELTEIISGAAALG